MGYTTSYWQKERWSRRAADTLISYGRCWNPSLGNWDVNWRVGVLSEEQTPQVIVFSGKLSEKQSVWAGACLREPLSYHSVVSGLYCGEHASCFRAGSKEGTREASWKTKLQVLLVRLHGARPSLPWVNSRNKVSKGG